MRPPLVLAALFAVAPLAVVAVLAFGHDPVALQAARGLNARAADYEGSEACRVCHPAQHESWSRTYHRSMTQLPDGDTVVGRFDGRAVRFYGRSAVPFEQGGHFFLRVPDGEGERVAEIALCVGSHRYQQYFELVGSEKGDSYRRLPLLWHIGEQRWMHLNGVFLEPDDFDWDAHDATWNENCIFCHNTAPQPHIEVTRDSAESERSERFRSRVAELGIACEACHGPGEAHVARLASPLARYRANLAGGHDLSIVHPGRVGQLESLALCGQCHAQRMPKDADDLWRWLDSGPSFRPGDELEQHVVPLTCETATLDPRRPNLFRDRFWKDGTARLSAYEYLGVTQSPCLKGGELTCGTCHVMHSGDVAGNIEPRMRGDDACTQCHEDIARDMRGHAHHDPERSGARCLDCHMPRMVYGIVEIHRSHRVESPDVKRDVEAGRPNACTTCHLDRSASWAADAMREWWGERYQRPASRPDKAPLDIPEAIASLHSGDAVQRAVYAWHFGRTTGALEPRDKLFAVAHLLIALGDGYPSIRTLARRSLRTLDAELRLGLGHELEAFDTFALADERRAAVHALLGRLAQNARQRGLAGNPDAFLSATGELDLERVVKLLDLQSDHVIAIGE